LPEIAGGGVEACQTKLEDILVSASAGYANLLVTDASGRGLCSARGAGNHDFSDRDWFRNAVAERGFVVGRYIIGRVVGRPVLSTALPVMDAEGRVTRVILAALDVAWLDRGLQGTRLAPEAVMSLVDGNGTVLARQPPDPRAVGRRYSLAPVVADIAAGKAEGTGEQTEAGGRSVLYAYSRLPGTAAREGAVYVAVRVPKERVLARAQREFVTNLGIVSALFLAALGGAWFLTESFVLRKVRILVDAARRIAAGDFTARADLGHGHGELTELADAFDDMAASIERHVQQARGIMEVAPEAIILTDEAGRIVMANAQTQKLFGYHEGELIGQPIEILLPDRLRTQHRDHRERYGPAGVVRAMDLLALRKDGSEFPVDVSIGTLGRENGRLTVSAVRDITERKRHEAQILHQATHDALTGLPNRAFFRELLVRALTQAQRSEKLLAVMFLDLDGFKNINDTLGHEAGDVLLKATARRIVSVLRKDDVVARQGGDEFTILLQGIHAVPDIIQVAEKLLAAIAEPLTYDYHEMYVTGSVGITVFPFDDTDVDSLLRNADTAMYRAKEAGKNRFSFYTAEMNAQIVERMETEAGLRRALQENQFELYYQPQAEIHGLGVVGMEALIRWNHPERGMIAPDRFIPVAEESGLIVPIGEWVLRAACRQIKAWQEAGFRDIKVAVNLSARQFREERLLERVARALEETGLDPRSGGLELELTESMMMQSGERTAKTLAGLSAVGLKIAIDDFGTGYSSLSYLKHLPISTLKIDQSFVRDIAVDPDDAAIAATVVALGHSLKLKVIAEGVENADQLARLRTMGCDEIQGYYLSKPLPAAAATAFLQAAAAAGGSGRDAAGPTAAYNV
jgi:diguanylate cyclase (GGDEF)-like protein/PAS domain S-box-containing protein